MKIRTSMNGVSALLLVGSLALAACEGRGGDGPGAEPGASPAAQPLSEEAHEFLDRGNDAQREGRYADALALYRQAMELAPDHPVPQFGVYMAATALGDSALADSLRATLEVSSPDLLEMMHPGGGMGGGMGREMAPGLPPGADPHRSVLPPGHPGTG
jgi:tetratricopeptide (TPR) repeat protein